MSFPFRVQRLAPGPPASTPVRVPLNDNRLKGHHADQDQAEAD